MGSLAQVGLALATAVGAWINLLLVLGFAVRAGYLDLTARCASLVQIRRCRRRARRRRLWLTAQFAAVLFRALPRSATRPRCCC